MRKWTAIFANNFLFKKFIPTKFKKNPLSISNKLTLFCLGLDQILTNKMINWEGAKKKNELGNGRYRIGL